MTNINEFIKKENLEKMTQPELMQLWEFILSDFNLLNTEHKIKEILDERNKLGGHKTWEY